MKGHEYFAMLAVIAVAPRLSQRTSNITAISYMVMATWFFLKEIAKGVAP
jgi:hypothetical protein